MNVYHFSSCKFVTDTEIVTVYDITFIVEYRSLLFQFIFNANVIAEIIINVP